MPDKMQSIKLEETSPTGANDDAPTQELSKNAQKRLKKMAFLEANKDKFKQQRKDKKKEKQVKKRLKRAEMEKLGIQEQEAEKAIQPKSKKAKLKLEDRVFSPIGIIIDASFDDLMTHPVSLIKPSFFTQK